MYANDEVFNVEYNESLDRLEIKRKSWTSRVIKNLRHHKIIVATAIMFVICSFMNCVLIYNFMEILKKV